MMYKHKLIRITTVPVSLGKLLECQLSFMSQYYEVIAVSSDEDTLRQVAAEQGVPFFCVELTRKISLLADLKALFKLYRFFRKEKPFIVHTHTPKAGTIGMLAARLASVPCRLHTVAGLPLLETIGAKRKLLEAVEKITYACAHRVYPNSKGLYNIILANKYAPEGKLKVIGNGSSNGIDIHYFDPAVITDIQKEQLRGELKIQHDDFVFIFIGRLVGDKGVNELVAAFERIGKQFAKARLLVLGKFEMELDPLYKETQDHLIHNTAISFVGFRNDVRPYLAISNVLAFPSYREGFPNVVMQAGAMGLPAIVTDINGCNEIIIQGRNGVIIPPKDADVLYKVMKRFLEEKELKNELSFEARDLIVNRYQQHLVWEAILDEYRSFESKYHEKICN